MQRMMLVALMSVAVNSFAMAQVPAGASATVAGGVVSASAPVAAVPAVVVPQTAAEVLQILPSDRVEGSVMAPLTIIEYASMTCSHCADFAKDTLPQLRKEWIATGKAKFVMRDLAWDNLALGMAKIARCAPAEQFKPLVESFFGGQQKIITSASPLDEIKQITRMAGMDDATVDACVKDAALHAQVLASKNQALEILKVQGTPAIFVNGVKVDGAVAYKDLKKVLDAEYAKVKK
ncbi:MAG: hypothetical protein EBR79_01890 [Proteobacteria bacterium]|nr:hypothetical protein [Pseudomonadota bacterium]